VVELASENARTKSIVLDAPDWPGHLAGQHVDVRLTAEDGYQAQRSYSIASAPEDDHLILTVERLDAGEVSPYLTETLQPGDDLELRGPIGGYEAGWPAARRPLIYICGPTGFVEAVATRSSRWGTTRAASEPSASARLDAPWQRPMRPRLTA
jgi:ferredoxin-NADP reductase